MIPATTTAATVKSWAALGLNLEKVSKINPKIHRSAGHMNSRALRVMEKRILKDLREAWIHLQERGGGG